MITLNEKITQDLNVVTGLIYNYIIVIDDGSENSIYLSDYNMPLNIIDNQESPILVPDLNLVVSDITYRVDSKKNSLQISNARIQVTNFPSIVPNQSISVEKFEHSKPTEFSDYVNNKNIMNRECSVYLKTQSIDKLGDCLLLYTGRIINIKHDSKKLTLMLEDLLNPVMNEKLPRAKITNKRDTLREDDINRVIPAVYGQVRKSPVVLLTDSSNNRSLSIYTLADDIFSTTNPISLGTMFSESIIDAGIEVDQSPLYVHKGDYYNVLNEYDNSVIQSNTIADWVWPEDTQVTNEGNYCEIHREMNGILPRNAPAVNEIQCIKLRTPTDMIVAANPFGGDVDFSDVNARLVTYLDAGVLNPGNALISQSDINNNSIWNNNSYAQIPNPFWDAEALFFDYSDMELPGQQDEIDNLADIVYGMRLHGYDGYTIQWQELRGARGIFAPRAGSGDNNDHLGQTILNKTLEWLHINAHNFNTLEDFSSLDYQAILTYQINKNTLDKVWGRFIADHINKHEYLEYAMTVDETISTSSSPGWKQWVFSERYQVDTLPYISVPDNMENFNQGFVVYGGNQDYFNTCLPDGEQNTMMIGTQYTDWHSNQNTFDSIYNQQPVNYPQSYIYVIKITDEWIVEKTGYRYVALTQENGSFSNPNSWYPDGNCKVYNMWDTDPENPGDGTVFANVLQGIEYFGWFWPDIDDDDFETIGAVPWADSNTGTVLLSQDNFMGAQRRVKNLERPYNTGPRAHQLYMEHDFICNGEQIDVQGPQGWSPTDSIEDRDFMDGLSTCPQWYYSYTNGSQVNMKEACYSLLYLFIGTVGAGEVGLDLESTVVNDRRPFPENQFVIQSGTIIPHIAITPTPASTSVGAVYEGTPTYHARTDYESGASTNYFDMDFGDLQNVYPWNILPNDAANFTTLESRTALATAEKRLGVAFLFNDLEISDEIKADTFLIGKLQTEVITTTNTDQCYYKIGIAGIDKTNQGDLDFSTIDSYVNNLTEVRLDEAISNFTTEEEGTIIKWSNIGITESENNTYSEPTRIGGIVDGGFWNVNNYNGLLLEHKLDPVAGIGEETFSMKNRVYNIGILHFIILDDVFNANWYANVNGRRNEVGDVYFDQNTQNYLPLYSELDPEGSIDKVEGQISHIIEKELGFEDSIDRSRQDWQGDMTTNFTVSEEIEFKKLVNDIFANSGGLTASTTEKGKLRFYNFNKYVYASNLEIYYLIGIINSQDVIKYQMRRTPTQDLCTLVNVKYDWDYDKKDYRRETGFIDSYDLFGNGDSDHRRENNLNGYSYESLGLRRDSKILEIENKYITDREEANIIRDYELLNNCNQKLSIDLTLPLKYIKHEVGDVIKFDSTIDNINAYGEDYSINNTRNGQLISKYFLVISKKIQKGNLRLTVQQIHQTSVSAWKTAKGSPTRSWSEFDPPETIPTELLVEDCLMIDSFLLKELKYVTQMQEWAMDLDSNGLVQLVDSWIAWGISFSDPDESPSWSPDINLDFNSDGMVDSYDISPFLASIIWWNNNLQLIEADGNPLTGGYEYMSDPSTEWLATYDLNEDGYVNHADFLILLEALPALEEFNIELYIQIQIENDGWFYPFYP